MTRHNVRSTRGGPCLAMGLAVLASTGARAQAPSYCTEAPGLWGTPVSLALVEAPGRTAFVKGSSAGTTCPSEGAACRDSGYLVTGNAVLVGPPAGRFVCAAYVGATGSVRVGWLPAAALAPQAPGPVKAGDWVGSWTSGPERRIEIRRSGDGLVLDGDATYGAQDPERVKTGAINLGEFSATLRPSGNTLAFTQGSDATLPYEGGDSSSCRVRLRLLAPILVVEDNNACGGANVTFTGYYRRR